MLALSPTFHTANTGAFLHFPHTCPLLKQNQRGHFPTLRSSSCANPPLKPSILNSTMSRSWWQNYAKHVLRFFPSLHELTLRTNVEGNTKEMYLEYSRVYKLKIEKIKSSQIIQKKFFKIKNKMKPTNPNADTNVEEQRQDLFVTLSSEPTCGTPWLDSLRWHSCRTPLLDTNAQGSCKTLLLDTLAWHSCKKLLLDTLVRHS